MSKKGFIKAMQIASNSMLYGIPSKEAFMRLVSQSQCLETHDNMLKKLKWREDNHEWLNQSANIAIKILRELRSQEISKEDLSIGTDIPIERINETVKGSADLTLSEIYKLSNYLKIKL